MERPDTELLIQPRLLDRRRMAACLCLSEDTLDKLRKCGCPYVRVPGVQKSLFDPDDVVAWLKAESEAAAPDAESLERAKAKADAIFGS